jgi:hypothetical protein
MGMVCSGNIFRIAIHKVHKEKKNIYISPPTLENASDVLNIDTISMQFDHFFFFLKIMVVRK